ncbi:hypothetical protein P1X14_19755 [Sphingomonas sp. AOB5]|uniref:hypothetical protein n=1 Tax=Sphingomonas sp. AOB5 TaxID=3034017 RepID=UPI0023F87E19|nr:hypothetical protein [Sphingomonas sp. AOB5]MDF7777501.1 hypothetical protein [Sphingomonas sp. AOB5]
MRILLIPALMLLGATDAPAQKDKIPEATPDGEPVSCLSLSQIRETHVRSDRVIDFVVSRRKVYRNTLPHDCPGLGFEGRYIHRTSLNQICSLDTITVLRDNLQMSGPTCGLGKFQPVTLAK